ncbi:MAG: aminodeoxychorismate synthase component I [Zoogloeaceae bacterium]|nr:aminodeoxychorismate synthase component I [Zoogloeaceae bacterium]
MISPAIDSFSDEPIALFDDNLSQDGDLFLDRFAWAISCTSPEHLNFSFRLIEAARQQGAWVAVAASYELGLALEPRLQPLHKAGGPPLLQAWVFGRGTRQTPSDTELQLGDAVSALGPDGSAAGIGGLRRSITKENYTKAIRTLHEAIANGECYQVNFTYRLHGELWGHPISLYRALRSTQPSRYGALIRLPHGYLLSRSPELFVKHSHQTLTCKPMKGTSPPDGNLAKSEKDLAENTMIVDLLRNDLGRLAPPGAVTVDKLFEIEQFPTLQQMTSTITANQVKMDLSAIFRALFPSGSITGAPKIRAMEIIHGLETSPRGIYCGAIGWIAPTGDWQLNVAIRTLEISNDGTATVGVGSGITFNSHASEEWEECHLKERFVFNARYPLRLIETMRRERNPSAPFPFLESHLNRLRASSEWFGIPWDEAATRKRLFTTDPRTTHGVTKVRVTVDLHGNLQITESPLEELAPNQTVIISPAVVSDGNRLCRHKTTVRNQYEKFLSAAIAAGHFDILFFNQRGELVEGARTNIFLQTGHQLLTPPLSSGALPGVLRTNLIASGLASERKLTRHDLLTADRIFVGNALRGLVSVKVAHTILQKKSNQIIIQS